MKMIRWKGDPETAHMHRHDYRWIKDELESEAWIREHWEVEE